MFSGYFDYASSTPLDPKVKKEMDPYFRDLFFNPSAHYKPSREVSASIKDAKLSVASILGCKPTEIIFTAGGTEANNLAIYGVMSKFVDGNMIISSIEHDSVLMPANEYQAQVCPVNEKGLVEPEILKSLINDKTVLISVMLANNEIGTLQPIKEIAEIVKQINVARKKNGSKYPLYLHSDCAQATNYLDINVNRLGVDLMSINGGKIYGPKQSGLLFVRHGISLKPLILGGGQERGLRSGTENVPSIIGFAKALEIANRKRKSESVRIKDLQNKLIHKIQTEVGSYRLNGSKKHRLPNNIHLTFFGTDNERVVMKLDELGFQVAVGSACSASNDEPSHVLSAIGMVEEEIHSSIRITLGRYSNEASNELLVSALKSAVRA